jgi:deoxyhypusine synthase
MGKLRNTITDDFIDYSFATDSSMKHDLCVKIGGKSYVGSFNDVLDLIASDNGLSEGRIGILKRAVADVYIDYDFATDENLKNGMQVKIGDETFTGSFNDIIAQISSDAAV